MNKKIIVFAYSEPGYFALQTLIEMKKNIVAVFTHFDDEKENIWFPSVYNLAKEHNIPVFRYNKITEDITKEILDFKADLVLSIYYRRLIPDIILNSAPLGAYNLHGSLLPKYRGQTCINWAVVNGEEKTGATLHKMTDKADEGPIVSQKECTIEKEDTAIDVFHKISHLTKDIIREAVPKLEENNIVLTEQNHREATHFGRRIQKDGQIDFAKNSKEIYNLVRGVTHPFPGAFTFIDDRKLFIWQIEYEVLNHNYKIGEVVSIEPLKIATKDGLITVLETNFEDGEIFKGKDINKLAICLHSQCEYRQIDWRSI